MPSTPALRFQPLGDIPWLYIGTVAGGQMQLITQMQISVDLNIATHSDAIHTD
jgi:hypothetical protein